MRHSIAEELVCPACRSDLAIDSMRSKDDDCIEGFMSCEECGAVYPILNGVAIMVSDFVGYASQRPKLLGSWLLENRSGSMKKFLKDNARRVRSAPADRYERGGAWFKPYLEMHSPRSRVDKHFASIVTRRNFQDFYGYIVQLVSDRFASRNTCLEIGCTIGNTSREMAKRLGFVFGVDRSFSFIREARKSGPSKNMEFLVANSLELPFPGNRFDLVVSLNLLDLVEPGEFLSHIHHLLVDDGSVVLTDPYDFRDAKGDPRPLYNARTMRRLLTETGFGIDRSTTKESFIPWILRIQERAYLLYFADLIIAKKKSRPRKRRWK